jgi:hypothetical protein
MKLRAGVAGVEISKELQYVADRVKTAIFDEPNVAEEAVDVIKVVAPLKTITTAGMLAVRPALLLKELTIGLYKGIAIAATKIYGTNQFSLNSYRKAMSKLFTVDKKFSLEWNLIDAINNHYGFANSEVNSAVNKMKTSRRGVLMGLGP